MGKLTRQIVNAQTGGSCPAKVQIEKILDDLAYCESRNNDDVSIIDSNGLRSTGRFQYQDSTFIKYVEKYNLLPNAEKAEYLNFIHDGQVQRDLTRKILLDGGWTNWFNCGIKIQIEKRLREV